MPSKRRQKCCGRQLNPAMTLVFVCQALMCIVVLLGQMRNGAKLMSDPTDAPESVEQALILKLQPTDEDSPLIPEEAPLWAAKKITLLSGAGRPKIVGQSEQAIPRLLGAGYANIKPYDQAGLGSGCVTVDTSMSELILDLSTDACNNNRCPPCFVIVGVPTNKLTLSECSSMKVARGVNMGVSRPNNDPWKNYLQTIVISHSGGAGDATISDGVSPKDFTLSPGMSVTATCYTGGGNRLLWAAGGGGSGAGAAGAAGIGGAGGGTNQSGGFAIGVTPAPVPQTSIFAGNGYILLGDEHTVLGVGGAFDLALCRIGDGKALVCWATGGASYCSAVRQSGPTNLTSSQPVEMVAEGSYNHRATYLGTDKAMLCYRTGAATTDSGRCRVVTTVGTTITFGAETGANADGQTQFAKDSYKIHDVATLNSNVAMNCRMNVDAAHPSNSDTFCKWLTVNSTNIVKAHSSLNIARVSSAGKHVVAIAVGYFRQDRMLVCHVRSSDYLYCMQLYVKSGSAWTTGSGTSLKPTTWQKYTSSLQLENIQFDKSILCWSGTEGVWCQVIAQSSAASGALTKGTALKIHTGVAGNIRMAKYSSSIMMVCYTSSYPYECSKLEISGLTLSKVTVVEVTVGISYPGLAPVSLTDLITCYVETNAVVCRSIHETYSSTTVTTTTGAGTIQRGTVHEVMGTGGNIDLSVASVGTDGAVICFYDGTSGQCKLLTVTGYTLGATTASQQTEATGGSFDHEQVYMEDGKNVLCYRKGAGTGFAGVCKSISATVTDAATSSLTFGTAVTIQTTPSINDDFKIVSLSRSTGQMLSICRVYKQTGHPYNKIGGCGPLTLGATGDLTKGTFGDAPTTRHSSAGKHVIGLSSAKYKDGLADPRQIICDIRTAEKGPKCGVFWLQAGDPVTTGFSNQGLTFSTATTGITGVKSVFIKNAFVLVCWSWTSFKCNLAIDDTTTPDKLIKKTDLTVKNVVVGGDFALARLTASTAIACYIADTALECSKIALSATSVLSVTGTTTIISSAVQFPVIAPIEGTDRAILCYSDTNSLECVIVE